MPLKVHPLIWLLIAAVGALLLVAASLPGDSRTSQISLFRWPLTSAVLALIGAWGALSQRDFLLRVAVVLGVVAVCAVAGIGADRLNYFPGTFGFMLIAATTSLVGFTLLRLAGWRLVGEGPWREEENESTRDVDRWQFSVWNLMSLTIVISILLGFSRLFDWQDSVTWTSVIFGLVWAFPPGLAVAAALFHRPPDVAASQIPKLGIGVFGLIVLLGLSPVVVDIVFPGWEATVLLWAWGALELAIFVQSPKVAAWYLVVIGVLGVLPCVFGIGDPIGIVQRVLWIFVVSGFIGLGLGKVVRIAGYQLEKRSARQPPSGGFEAESGQKGDPAEAAGHSAKMGRQDQ